MPLLLYLSHAGDPQRFAVGPTLAAAAERAGWEFECYYGALRAGRHFGGGDPGLAQPGWSNGSLVAGGRHLEQAARLAQLHDVVALGDPDCVLWPALEAAWVQDIARTLDPRELYEAAFNRLDAELPGRTLVIDAGPQGAHGVVVAPYLYPAFFAERVLGLEVSGRDQASGEVRGLYVRAGLGIDADGAVGDRTYAELTAELANRYRDWGRGVLLGDPDLVAAQLPRARRRRLLPLYGHPQVDAIQAADEIVRAAEEPVWGRQYDDRDFFELGRRGKGFQLVDPDPPFGAPRAAAAREERAAAPELDDATLESWADEGRVLATLLFWSGMVRELDCVPRLIDVVASTGLRAGLVLTVPSIELGASFELASLSAPVDRGGVLGLLDVLLASTGRGVCAETLMPDGALAATLASGRQDALALLPGSLAPRGWWPLLDAPLVPHRAWRIQRRGLKPVIPFTPRGTVETGNGNGEAHRDFRAAAGELVRRAGLDRLFEERRPFNTERPGDVDRRVVDAVRAAGFDYMWSKSGFGSPRVVLRDGEFVALSLTAGNWDGWSPFYTVGSATDVGLAERRLLRGGPGWLVGLIDAPLWALSGEILERGPELLAIAKLVAHGGRSGRLLNATPNTIARYARLLAGRGLIE
jgi:hypothetical protein